MILLTGFDIYPWRPLKDGKKLAHQYKLMTPGLEVGVGLVNRTEHSGVDMFEKPDTNISGIVDVGSGISLPMPTIPTTAFLKTNREHH